MEVKLIKETENPLFSRQEFHFEVKSLIAPSHEEVNKTFSEKFSFDPSLMRIKGIKGRFGTQIFDVFVNVYSSKEEFDRIVKKTKQEVEAEKKKVEEEAKAKEEAKKPVEKSAEEKPAEAEVVEEKPVEEKVEEKKEEPVNEESVKEESIDKEIKKEEVKENEKKE